MRRKYHLMTEKQKQHTYQRQKLYSALPPDRSLKSRFSFLNRNFAFQMSPENHKERFWRLRYTENWDNIHPMNYRENLLSGGTLDWYTWKTLNILRRLKSRIKATLDKWGVSTDNVFVCASMQTMEHIVRRSGLTMDELFEATPEVMRLAEKW